MGRWGFGLLEGDSDLDIIDAIFDKSVDVKPFKKDVIRLRLKVWERAQLNKKSTEGKDDTKDDSDQTDKKPSKEELEEDWALDIHLNCPRFPRIVRDYLNSGVLASLIKDYGPTRANGRWSDVHGHKKLILIAYCAMELGCILPPGFLARLKANYQRIDLFGDESQQIRQACDEYIDGKPYRFASLGLVETAYMDANGLTHRPEPQPAGLEPVPSQETATTAEQPAPKRRKVETKADPTPAVEEFCLHFDSDTCANCGATQGHGTPELKRCKGCKNTLYCFEGCQKWHWFRHRSSCKVDQEVEEPAKDESTDKGGDVSKEEVEEATA